MNYLVADLITRIKNAAAANRREVYLPFAKLSKSIAMLLVKQGYLKSVSEEEVDGNRMLKVEVAYVRRIPVLTDVEIVSKPSLRIYISVSDLGVRVKRGHSTLVLSTSRGVMTGKEAQKEGVGGELLFEIQ